MNIELQKKSNKSALYFFYCLLGLTLQSIFFPSDGNIWDDFNIIPMVLMFAMMYYFETYIWFHFRSKGYGVIFSVIAMIITTFIPLVIPLFYLFVPDKFPVDY